MGASPASGSDCVLDAGAVPAGSTKVDMPYQDPEARREYQRKWIAARREKYIDIHGGKCSRCGCTHNLEFDHVDPARKIDHRIWSWSLRRIEAELEKCQLLCRDCHQVKTSMEVGYPDREHGTNLMYLKGFCRCEACKAAHAAVNAQYRLSTLVGPKQFRQRA